MTALNCHTISNRDILYVTSNFCSSLLIDEDELVMPRVSMVIEHPAISRVVSILIDLDTSISDTKLRGSRDTDEVGCDVGALTVSLDHVNEGGDPSKVDDGVVVVNRDGREVIGCSVGKGSDGRHQVVSPSFYSIGE
jgi:hypothetical protein